MNKRSLLIFLVLIFSKVYSQNNSFIRYIKWNTNINVAHKFVKLDFPNAYFPDSITQFPYYKEHIELPFYCDLIISDIIAEKLDDSISDRVFHGSDLPDTFVFKKYTGVSRGKNIINYLLLPVFKSKFSGETYRITSFTINIPNTSIKKVKRMAKSYGQHSILSSGKWYKIKLNDDGVYKITYAQLKSMGFENPGNVRVYGNGGGMLPKNLKVKRPDDLRENAVEFVSGSDGVFNDGDYILFYGQGPNVWNYDAKKGHFYHSQNKFSNFNYYFLTDNLGRGKQISDANEPTVSNVDVTSFDDYIYHEPDQINLLGSGSEWYGDQMDVYNPLSFGFNFPNIVQSSDIFFYYSVIARSITSGSYFTFGISGTTKRSSGITRYDSNPDYAYAGTASGSFKFTATSDNTPVTINYVSSGDNGAAGYIDFFGLNVRRNLIFEGDQMLFRDLNSVGPGKVAEFTISNTSQNVAIWDVTDNCVPVNMVNTVTNSTLTFSASVNSIRHFIIFKTNSGLLSPIIVDNVFKDVGIIDNQDIHGASNPDLIIVAPDDTGILRQAQILADFRTRNDGFKVFVTTTNRIYNEFSSGKKDVSAIRDMAKMFYDRSTGENDMPKYLLLFGDGTYDNKSINVNNSNLIPTYESPGSLVKISSYVADDFFGWLDDADTLDDQYNFLDIGVGRFPIKNSTEAEQVVKKVINYSNPVTMADWRNIVCFIGDDDADGDSQNIHVWQADSMARQLNREHPNFIIQKVYLDAYNYITTSVGQTAPDAKAAIDNRVNKGSLIINYTGHGGPNQLTHQGVINTSSVMEWNNINHLPLFITATCEFSKFDDVVIDIPGKQFEVKTSAGEEILLNPDGGGIALITAARLVESGGNWELNREIYDTIFSKDSEGNYYRLGDDLRIAKNNMIGDPNKLNFALLGDPSTLLAFPKGNGIITDSINGKSLSSQGDSLLDTLKALSFVSISGHIVNENKTLLNNFNGRIYPTVFDKEETRTTLGNDNHVKFNFKTSENIVFKGIESVKAGRFKFQFQVPKDIKLFYNNGKIVYYATDSVNDLAGYTNKFIIGGIDNSAKIDTIGPKVLLYMNDTNFVSGGITDANPLLLVKLLDHNGINVTGAGIGHDLTAIIDGDFTHLISLNDFYQNELDDYTSGSALYPLYNLNPGVHVIKVIAWDLYNNSSSNEITFRVVGGNNLVLTNIINYPNPFTNFTNFVFESNWSEEALNIQVRIYSYSGQLINIIQKHDLTVGYRTPPLQWDGTNANGYKVSPGIYFYQIQVNTKSGKFAQGNGKLIIVHSK